MNDTSNRGKDLVLTHLAATEDSFGNEDGYVKVDYVQSCITFKSEERVPAGKKYSVMKT